VPGPGFQPAEAEAIAREYGRRCAQSIRFGVEVVPALPLTGRGKFKFVEQLIPDELQQALSEGKNEVA
jgi:hypothetical protein